MIKRIFLLIFAAFLVLFAVVLVRTLRLHPEPTVRGTVSQVPVDGGAAIERFAGAIRIQTISEPEQPVNQQAMAAFRDYLQTSFPRVHAAMQREVVGHGALLFTWKGSDPSLAPVLLMGHMDVVPVEPGTEKHWTYPPYAGQIADGYVWGRGSMDDKVAVLALMEAAEALLAQGFTPKRTILFAFGDDEENDGNGAKSIVALLQGRNVHPEFVMDEGGSVQKGVEYGLHQPVAMVGIAEKGIVSAELTSHSTGGHSSVPPKASAIGILSAAVLRLEKHQLPARLTPVTEEMFESMAPYMPFGRRMIMGNLWLFRPLLLWQMSQKPGTNAMIRTTTALTMFNGGVKDNVLPNKATAVVNYRILPGDTVASVMAHTQRVAGRPAIRVSEYASSANDPSIVSPTNGPGYAMLTQTIHTFFPHAAVAPYLVLGATDSRTYYAITPNVYRFFPAVREQDDHLRVHGTDERMGTVQYLQAIQFMALLMENMNNAQ